MMSIRIRSAMLAGAVGIAVLTGCGGTDSIVDAAIAAADADVADSTSQTTTEVAAASGPSLLQADVPIPDEQTFFDVTMPPPHWPAFLGVPETLDTTQGFFLDQPTPQGRSLSATFVHADGDTYGSEALDQIVAMGFDAIVDNERDGGRFVILRRGDQEVQITLGPDLSKISIFD